MTGIHGHAHHAFTCECGKRAYLNKTLAKCVCKRTGPDVRPYRCRTSGLWHVGHLADTVRHGWKDRRSVYQKQGGR